MSWFQNDAVLVDERPREAVADGVLLERRSLIRLSAATVAAGLAACATPSRGNVGEPTEASGAPPGPAPEPTPTWPPSDGMLDIADFLDEMYPRAQEFVGSGGEREESYLMAIGELMARLQAPTVPEAQTAMQEFQQLNGAPGERLEMWVVMFALEPGQGFSHHDHRDYNGVILGVEGEAHVTNYDILGDTLVPPQGETFQIRQTRDDLILPGRFSSLGRTRENVHELEAGAEGATVLDVFTFLAPDAKSYFMNVEPEPRDPERRIYDAIWA